MKDNTREIKTNLPESFDPAETEVTFHVTYCYDDPYRGAEIVDIDWIEGADGSVVDVPEEVCEQFLKELMDGSYAE